MKDGLSQAQVDALEGMIERRMYYAKETREQACKHIADYFQMVLRGPVRYREAVEGEETGDS